MIQHFIQLVNAFSRVGWKKFAPPRRLCYNGANSLMLYVRYMAKDGCRETFVRELVEVGILTLIREEPGCLAYDYYFSAQDENELLLIERWESAAHQRVHMEQPHMARLREIKDKYIADTRLGRVRLED